MRAAEPFIRLAAFLLLISARACWALCKLENGTIARCHDLNNAKYINTYHLETLRTAVNEPRLTGEIFYKLASIRNLHLTHGELETIEQTTFDKLTELRSLDLSYNRIKSLPASLFEHAKRLQHLNLRWNLLTGIPEAVSNARGLKTLDLLGNPLICDCATLQARDTLISRKIHISKKTLCAGPASLKSKALVEPDARIVCMFEDQDREMQMDQPGSSDATSPDDGASPEMVVETTVPVTPKSEPTSVATKSDDDDDDKGDPTGIEGSGTGHQVEKDEDEELIEASGIESSGTGVPPISWDTPDDNDEDETEETSSVEPAKTTTDAGLLDMIWGALWSTSTAPDDDEEKKHEEVPLEGEGFINVSSESTLVTTDKPSVNEKPIVPVIAKSDESARKNDEKEKKTEEGAVEMDRIVDDAKSDKIPDDANAEASDASATRQPKKGMGSYIVLAALLGILAILIGFAAYRGDFCRKRRKRNDPERGTELKDMTKSLLDTGNSPQPKISSNGNLENIPLVSTPDDSKIHEGRKDGSSESPDDPERTRYAGIAPEVVDPVKPPRKSYAPNDEPDRAPMSNGNRSSQNPTDDPVCLMRNKGQTSVGGPVNGKTHHDSASSLGTESRDSPSITTNPRISSPTNGSLGMLQGLARPPLSPGAQRVKITLQENPDSVPKTPILITRTKTGENLVKTP